MKVPFLSFNAVNNKIKEEVISTFESFFDSNYYVLGPYTTQFEKDYAQYSNTKYCLGISNGLDALHISLKALNIGPGDEVIVPSNTYIATVLAVSMVGATPVLVEPNPDTFNLDPAKIKSSVTSKTKCIMPVHLYGQPCEMDSIMEIAKKLNLFVVEDNAQSQGAKYNGKLTGTFGNVNATSFYPTKNLGALGEAGAINTDDEKLYETIKSLRNYGSEKRYHNEFKGFNNRIDELQAGILSVKLKYLDDWNLARKRLAAVYNEELSGIGDLQLPVVADKADHVYHLYVIKTNRRDELATYLKNNGIDTIIHYPIPPHLQKAYQLDSLNNKSFPIAEEVSNTVLSIPLFIGMSVEQQAYVIQNIKQFYRG